MAAARSRRSSQGAAPANMVVMIVVSVASFFAGTLFSLQAAVGHQVDCSNAVPQASIDAMVKDLVQQALQQAGKGDSESLSSSSSSSSSDSRFPDSVRKYATGMSRMTKLEFAEHFDMGVPLDQTKPGEEDVLLLYSSERAHPPKYDDTIKKMVPIPHLDVTDATEKCEELHIVLTDQTNRKQCVAIVPQFESFHIQKWMRVDGKGGALDATESLKYVSRGYQSNGREKFRPPEPKHTKQLWDMLAPYIESIDQVLKDLKPLVKKVAKNNQLIIMVCNKGQSELLMNFVCSVKARGLDYSQVLVFATDLETKALAEGMGLTAFFDEINFGKMPSEAAKGYGDRKFVAMMLAKVFCVQMVSMLGFDFLFQDVDIIWYKHPLEYFNKPENKGFDVYFQDDGAHSTRYAPYSANSGFYFVRHNDRTQFFLTSILMAGDLVIKTDSHQQALIALLAEHSSLYGLRVKVLSRDLEEFPGGYQFHQKTGKFMRAFFRKELHPYIFHMSWTANKDNKLLYFRQVGEWYLEDQCIQKTVEEIGSTADSMISTCCHPEPLISCHYRDKPSVIPCHDSPPIDKGKPSWWGEQTS